MVIKRRSRKTKKRLNRISRRTIKRVRKKKYSRKKKSNVLKRNKKQMGGAAAADEMITREHRFILDRIERRAMSPHLIRQHEYIWDIISTCNAPPELYRELLRIGIPEINRRFIDSCTETQRGPTCGIFKFEEMMMGKKWWIKSKAQDRLLLRKIIGDFIIAKGLDGISMPAFYGVMVQKDPDADGGLTGGSHVIKSLRNNLTKDEYTAYRLLQQHESHFAKIHEFDEKYPASVHDAITRIKTEGHQLAGVPGGDGYYRCETEPFDGSYKIMNGEMFWVDTYSATYDIYLLLEHVPTALKMCDNYVGLHIMYLINTFPLDLGSKKYGVNFCVTEAGICSIIDCEIKGDTQVDDFFDNFSMISDATNFEEHVRMENSYNSFTEESLRGDVPCLKKAGHSLNSNECNAVSYYYDKQKVGLFFLYYLLLTRKLTIENVSDYRIDGKNFTIEDVAELKTILSGDHFTRCVIPHQFEILDTLLSL